MPAATAAAKAASRGNASGDDQPVSRCSDTKASPTKAATAHHIASLRQSPTH